MHRLGNIFDFYINSSIHVALSVVSLTYITLIDFNIGMDFNLLLFNFFATITGYNFVKYFGLAKFHHRSLANWLKTIQIFSAICFVFLIYLTFQLAYNTLIWLGVLGFITFLYAVPFLPKQFIFDKDKNLRSIGGLKIYVIAAVWTAVTVLLPMINNSIDINYDIIIESVQRFAIVFVWTLPFEIRDLKYDSIKLSTIPQNIGILPTKILGIILTGLFFALSCYQHNGDLSQILIIGLVSVVTFALLMAATINQSKYYSGFWVEAIPIAWLIFVLMF